MEKHLKVPSSQVGRLCPQHKPVDKIKFTTKAPWACAVCGAMPTKTGWTWPKMIKKGQA